MSTNSTRPLVWYTANADKIKKYKHRENIAIPKRTRKTNMEHIAISEKQDKVKEEEALKIQLQQPQKERRKRKTLKIAKHWDHANNIFVWEEMEHLAMHSLFSKLKKLNIFFFFWGGRIRCLLYIEIIYKFRV